MRRVNSVRFWEELKQRGARFIEAALGNLISRETTAPICVRARQDRQGIANQYWLTELVDRIGEIAVALRLSRYAQLALPAGHELAVPLLAPEEEQFVLARIEFPGYVNRTADIKAKVIIMVPVLRQTDAVIGPAIGVHSFVAVILKRASVKRAAAALRYQVNLRAARTPVLGLVIAREDVDFLNSVTGLLPQQVA